MKVIAFNGSPKSNGNTAGSLKIVGEELIKEGIDFEIIDVGVPPTFPTKSTLRT